MFNPFICYEKPRAVVLDARVYNLYYERFNEMGIEVIKTIKHPKLYDAISFHPDIVMCGIEKNKFVIAPLVYDYYKKKFEKYEVEVLKGSTELLNEYPNNIAYNVLIVDKYVFHKLEFMDNKLKEELRSRGYEFINVKQGYAKCSVAVVSNKAIMTSDTKIAKLASDKGIEALILKPGDIELKDMNYGFIGGATGNFLKKEFAFAGSLNKYKEGNKVKEFLKNLGVEYIELSKDKLIDVGTIIPIY